MLILSIIKKTIKLLHSDSAPGQIAGGVAFGALLGLTPFFGLLNIIVFIVMLLVDVNIGAALLSAALFGLLGFAVDPLAHAVGYALLVNTPPLTPLWGGLYNMPVVPFTRFYNTVVLGNLVVGLAGFAPVYLVSRYLIVRYRSLLRDRVNNLKVVKWLKLTRIYSIYARYRA